MRNIVKDIRSKTVAFSKNLFFIAKVLKICVNLKHNTQSKSIFHFIIIGLSSRANLLRKSIFNNEKSTIAIFI